MVKGNQENLGDQNNSQETPEQAEISNQLRDLAERAQNDEAAQRKADLENKNRSGISKLFGKGETTQIDVLHEEAIEEDKSRKEITDKEATEFSHDKNFDVFTSVIDREDREALEGRERSGRLLKKGTKVISNPETPGYFEEDAPENRREFIQQGFFWREQGNKVLVKGDTKKYFEAAAQKAKEFKEKTDAIKTTMLTEKSRETLEGQANAGRLLKEGVGVIVDHVYEELFMEDTPENRADFIKNGGTWKPEK